MRVIVVSVFAALSFYFHCDAQSPREQEVRAALSELSENAVTKCIIGSESKNADQPREERISEAFNCIAVCALVLDEYRSRCIDFGVDMTGALFELTEKEKSAARLYVHLHEQMLEMD